MCSKVNLILRNKAVNEETGEKRVEWPWRGWERERRAERRGGEVSEREENGGEDGRKRAGTKRESGGGARRIGVGAKND